MENQESTKARKNRPNAQTKKKILYSNTVFTLPEGKTYFGEIVDSHQFVSKKDSEERWSITIKLDGRVIKFCNVNKLPLSEYSPLNGLLAEIDEDGTGEAAPEDLIGYEVEFTTKITEEGFCGFKTINFVEEDDEDEDTDESEEIDEDEDE